MIKCLAHGHNAVSLVRPEPDTPQSRVKHSTTEPPHSSGQIENEYVLGRYTHFLIIFLGNFMHFERHQKHGILSVLDRVKNV